MDWPPLLGKKVVERIELVSERRLAHRIAVVEQDARAAEDAAARSKKVITRRRRAAWSRPEEGVVLEAAARACRRSDS